VSARTLIAALAAASLLTGCASLTPTQKKAAYIVGGILIVGAVAAHNADHGNGGPVHITENGKLVQCSGEPEVCVP
jgi:major membrane immunogen (membrane-anchored lipoprotein)